MNWVLGELHKLLEESFGCLCVFSCAAKTANFVAYCVATKGSRVFTKGNRVRFYSNNLCVFFSSPTKAEDLPQALTKATFLQVLEALLGQLDAVSHLVNGADDEFQRSEEHPSGEPDCDQAKDDVLQNASVVRQLLNDGKPVCPLQDFFDNFCYGRDNLDAPRKKISTPLHKLDEDGEELEKQGEQRFHQRDGELDELGKNRQQGGKHVGKILEQLVQLTVFGHFVKCLLQVAE